MSEQSASHAVILFDGDCSLCNRSVQFILKRDAARRFQFASLQSAAGRRLLQQAGQQLEALPDSVVLLEGNRVYTRSTAALRIARHLNGLWPLLAVLLLVPALIRDIVYNYIARHRYRWFGRQQACLLPTPEMQGRFLTD
jgi:predicted DCC family thiol-disulfide oxidoreductase YuxK